MMRRNAILLLALAAGLGLGYAVVRQAGAADIAASLGRLGWQGFLAICLLHVGVFGLRAAALRVQVGPASFSACLGARLVKDGAGSLLWMVPGLGIAAGIRALVLSGINPVRAAACTFIDMLLESLTLMLCALLSLLLVAGAIESGHGPEWWLAFAAAAAPVLALAGLTRHAGAMRLVGKLVRRGARAFGRGVGRDLTDATAALYADRPRMLRASLVHGAGWLVSALQVWVAAAVMGVPLSLSAALALVSLVQAVTGMLFVVPWGAGVQEASFVLVGGLFGVDPATALVLSLAMRARDLLLGLPGVALWSVLEARQRWGRAATARLPDPVP